MQGVRAILATRIDRPWGLVADHPDNEGLPVAEAFEAYANTVCGPTRYEPDELYWFGIDKVGRFCEWNGISLEPIVEPTQETGSRQAFHARLSRMGLRNDGGGVRMMLDPVQEPFLPHGGMHLN